MNKVSVIGLGKLGTPLLAVLASKGFEVIGVDSDPVKVEALHRIEAPVNEPGVQELIDRHWGSISATTDIQRAVRDTEATFVIVPTPSEDSGAFSLEYVLAACREIGKALQTKSAYHLVVITSTVMPQDTRLRIIPTLETFSGKKAGADFGVCYSPEFIALGEVVKGLLQPDFILIGEYDIVAGDMLERIYGQVVYQNAPRRRMTLENAELCKLAVNGFVTMKISYANFLAQLCERLPGGDIDAVTGAMGQDRRIGKHYLKGAVAFGGPCFPRDSRALMEAARVLQVEAFLPKATQKVNSREHGHLVEIVRQFAIKDATFYISHRAYKIGTDVTIESVGETLAYNLERYDERVIDNPNEADVVILTLPELPADWTPHTGQTVIDCWRIMTDIPPGVTYIAIGRGEPLQENSYA